MTVHVCDTPLSMPGGMIKSNHRYYEIITVNLQIRDMVTDKQTGKMRLQFWRDTIDTIYQVIV